MVCAEDYIEAYDGKWNVLEALCSVLWKGRVPKSQMVLSGVALHRYARD